MNSYRDILLNAYQKAARIFAEYDSLTRSSFDIMRAVTSIGIPVLFRPTPCLLGATVIVDDDLSGIMVTTKRPLPIQRFTLAHELGHLLLGHKNSFDLISDEFGLAGLVNTDSSDQRTADTFASAVLAPLKLIRRTALRHHWSPHSLSDPITIYQLSLRLGLSFKATCFCLADNKILQSSLATRLAQDTKVKDMKTSLIQSDLLTNPWADVWVLSEQDLGMSIECGPDDIFVLNVIDHSSSGYLWDLTDSDDYFEILDERVSLPLTLGGVADRVLVLKGRATGNLELKLTHSRPWNSQSIGSLCFKIANFGREGEGFSRYKKQELLRSASA